MLGDPALVDRAIAHELTHIAQADVATIVWEEPLEKWLFTRLPKGEHLNRIVHLGFLGPLLVLVGSSIDYSDRPWEQEAEWFSDGC